MADIGGGENRDTAPTQDGAATVKFWLDIIGRYERDFGPWETRVSKIWDIYIDDRKGSKRRKMALLWANISLWQPAIYARLPEPNVSRRFSDADPVARVASIMLERCLITASDQNGLNDKLLKVRDDFLLGARGTAWARYEAEFEPIGMEELPADDPYRMASETGDDEALKGLEAPERIAAEHVRYDYVHWRDFGHTQARYWDEVTAVWRRTYLMKSELEKRFGAELAGQCALDHSRDDRGQFMPEHARKATVYEIWDKATRKVYFIAKGCPEPLEVVDPYLKLEGFWPCPKPAYGTLGTDNLIPVPDYVYYQDQCEEIDDLTARIGKLTEALKLVGFYPKGDDTSGTAQIEKALRPGVENVMLAVPSYAAFAEKGGVNQISWLPVEQVVKVLEGCIKLRRELKDNLHEVSGLSDVMRGATDADETASAQNLKSQWGQTRLKDRQKVIAEFVKELLRIGGEIMADRFQPETLLRMSNLKLPSRADLPPVGPAPMMGHNGGPPMMPPPGAGMMPPGGAMGMPA